MNPTLAATALARVRAMKLAAAQPVRHGHCKHGVYVGNPYGADHMCGMCEDGVRDDFYGDALRSARKDYESFCKVIDATVELYMGGYLPLEKVLEVTQKSEKDLGIVHKVRS